MRFAKELEPLHLLWIEDMITGDYSPFVNPDVYREVTPYTTTPIHTGEQIYLRQNYKALIESHAVNVVGPDPCDVGGIAELKWIAEYADLHGIAIAPHGTANGIFGLAALIQVCATLPDNLIAFEYPARFEPFWYEITEGFDGMPVQERTDRRAGSPRHGRRVHPRGGEEVPVGSRRRFLRLRRNQHGPPVCTPSAGPRVPPSPGRECWWGDDR